MPCLHRTSGKIVEKHDKWLPRGVKAIHGVMIDICWALNQFIFTFTLNKDLPSPKLKPGWAFSNARTDSCRLRETITIGMLGIGCRV